jgi:hypothetical protein
MRRPFTKGILLSVTSVLALTFVDTSPVFAHASCTATVRSQHSGTRSLITQEHETTRDAIKEAIEKQTTELEEKMEDTTLRIIRALTLAAKENSAHVQQQTEAQRRFADAQEVNATDRLRQEIRAEAESGRFDPNPFSCQLLDMFEAARGSGAPVTGDAVTRQAVNRISGNDENVQAGGAQLARSVVDARDAYEGFRGSDNATTDWAFVLNDPTIDLSDPDMQNVLSWIISNSVSATPARSMTEEELATPEGMARAAEAQERIGRQRAAVESINMSINMRTPVHTDDGTLAGKAQDSSYNRSVPERLSELQILDIETVSHYFPGPNRINGTNGQQNGLTHMNEKGWLQEIHRIMSIDARINYIRLELENRNAITNALILAAVSEN